MREIKFRAWDTYAKVMSDPFSLFGEFTLMGTVHDWQMEIRGIDTVFENGDGPDLIEMLDDLKIMQCTGLKDKNGKEIYEGDIVIAWSEGVKGVFEIKWRQEGSPCWLLYPNGQSNKMWYISATEHKKGKQFIDVSAKITTTEREGYFDDGLEIIGNIYEKPELLKE